jgi:hypothetical protein
VDKVDVNVIFVLVVVTFKLFIFFEIVDTNKLLGCIIYTAHPLAGWVLSK